MERSSQLRWRVGVGLATAGAIINFWNVFSFSKVVGFIDNSKPNFSHLVDDLAELLTSTYGVVRVLRHQKRAASVPAAAHIIDDYTLQCDLVIAGSGD